jgi:hypothetical protein
MLFVGFAVVAVPEADASCQEAVLVVVVIRQLFQRKTRAAIQSLALEVED